MKRLPIIALVTKPTRMDRLRERWATSRAIDFRMQHAFGHEVERRLKLAKKRGMDELDEAAVAEQITALADADELSDEDARYNEAVERVEYELDLGYPIKKLDLRYVPNFDFGRCIAVVVVGPDGLVANTAKYAGELPIIGINPDPERNDGVLLPFLITEARGAVQRVIKFKARSRPVTLAEINTNDGQRMLAFNDFYIGNRTHVSARYSLEYQSQIESQSSSGIIVSTGAGSTGWMSSVFNMARGLGRLFGQRLDKRPDFAWEDDRLFWTVREPFLSRHSQAGLIAGFLDRKEELVVGSQMAKNGVIFSDGIEEDFIEFNAGTIARFFVSRQKAHLVVP